MRKFLPILFSFIFAIIFFTFPKFAVATSHEAPVTLDAPSEVPEGDWRVDPEVTFVGKNAARSGNLLDFTLENYNWVCVTKDANGQCDNSNNPLTGVWLTTVTYIVTPLLFIVILAAAVIIIITRGRSITIMRFLPRFTGVLLLIFLSFALLQFFYQFTDVIQGFFLRDSTEFVGGASCPPECISQDDLLFVGWNYEDFVGLRLAGGEGDQYAESAYVSLLLTKLTAVTYYVMVGILVLRKIILWLFIVVSPIFPILLLFYPVRNTGKIWIGEFFRWLLYAPLFAIFLKGLVVLWREGIPLFFGNQAPAAREGAERIYQTSINILLGGPKEFVTPANSINLTETFALYVFSLLMLWGVIILPWILLQIFLDYASSLAVSESPVMKSLISRVNSIKGPPGAPAPTPSGGGTTINLPFAKKFNMPIPPSAPTGLAREIPTFASEKKTTQISFMPSAQVKAQTLSMVNMQLPSIRDIARFDTSLISNDKDRQRETIQIREKLEKIANPATATSSTERESFNTIREKLIKESESGNTLATSILNAANMSTKQSVKTSTTQIKNALSQIANPQQAAVSTAGATSVINHEKIQKMNESLVKAKREGNTLAASILSVTDRTPVAEIEKLQARIMDAKVKGEPIASQIADITTKQQTILPAANRIQTVSREDYDEVEKMWEENYRNLEVPSGMAGTRSEWIKDDISKIDNIINLLTAQDQEKVSQGMNEVSGILPFLLVGGFSTTEIISYLKAKQDAGKKTIAELAREEEQKVEVQVKNKKVAVGHLTASVAETSGDSASDNSDEPPFDGLREAGSAPENVAKPQLSNDLFAMTNLKLPKLSDIVKYEVRHLTKDKTESERIEKIHEVLEKLGNPNGLTNDVERVQYQELQDRIAQESIQGNSTADVILTAMAQLNKTVGDINLTLADVKKLMIQISNSASISNQPDRDYYSRLHDYLEKEYKEKNNTLAGKMLRVNESTKVSEIQEIQSRLSQEKDTNLALPQIRGAIANYSKIKQLKQFVMQLNSADNLTSGKERISLTGLRDKLKNESLRGNNLAASLIASSPKTSDFELGQLYAKIVEAGKNGDQVATAVISKITASGLPSAQRLQQITPEEEQEVKTLWQKAYTQYFVPQGFTEDLKGRSEWISSDISQIEETVNLLNSSDENQRNQGLEKVSSIIPFLLLGGFSNDDMNKYLNIKLEAAKSALTALNKDEEGKISVGLKNVVSQNKKVMSTSIPQSNTSDEPASIGSQQTQLVGAGAQAQASILKIINLPLPTMSDIARYETASLVKNKEKIGEISIIHDSLNKITNPSMIPDPAEREKFQKLTERLKEESSQNNILSSSLLHAATSLSAQTFNTATANQIKNIFSNIANPILSDQAERAEFEELRNSLDKDARANNNKLAQEILAVNEKTTVPQLEAIRESLKKAQLEGSRLASAVIWTTNKAILGIDRLRKSKEVLTQIANPALVIDVAKRSKYSKLHDELLRSSLEGNQMAHSILTVTDKTTDHEIDEILVRINDDKLKNDPIFDELTSLMVDKPVQITLPKTNQLQKVGKEDYESVKEIWKETYSTMEVPEGIGVNRKDWIKEDISSIGSTIAKLRSENPEEVEKGMSEVSNVLPFVLIGGFSKDEIVSYLNSKQDAANEVLVAETQEENDKLEVRESNNNAENQEKAKVAKVEEEE